MYGVAPFTPYIRMFYCIHKGLSPVHKERMPPGNARYGPIVFGFTNANPGVISVDNTFQVTAGQNIRVANVADDQSAITLNGNYSVNTVTNTTITLNEDTSGNSVYISGGFVTVIQLNEPTSPNPPFNAYNNVPDYWNQANQI